MLKTKSGDQENEYGNGKQIQVQGLQRVLDRAEYVAHITVKT